MYDLAFSRNGGDGACPRATAPGQDRWALLRRKAIAHASNVVQCDGPDSPHAFDIVPLQPRNGTLDAKCPICRGHGQWNTEIDLVSFRCKRAVCDYCHGAGWIETGDDPVGHPDIVMTPDGYPKWVVAYDPRQDAEQLPTETASAP